MKIVSLKQLAEEAVSHNPLIRKAVFLRRGEIPHLTGFSRAVFPPGETAEAHMHPDMCEVFLVESGSGRLRTEERDIPLAAADCIAVSAGEEHELVNTGDEDFVLIYFGIEV